MGFDITSLLAIYQHGFDTLIDVRSPAEFTDDHIPGAINLPALSNEERARVGTIYVQESAFKARKIGAALVARNAARHIEGPLASKDGGWRPLVYCWRGGQRSGSFASILRQIGWRADVVNGGYRAYRRAVSQALYDTDISSPLVLLDGNTGTGKTALLENLSLIGVQTLDLEGLANHRGSVFGSKGLQPSQKTFESRLALALSRFDPARPIVVEAESSRIGAINLPPRLFSAMRSAPRLTVSAPVEARADYLVSAYDDFYLDNSDLSESLKRLTALRGKATVTAWMELAGEGKYRELATELITSHYDPSYSKVRERRQGGDLGTIHASALGKPDLLRLADEIAARVNSISQ